MLSLAVLVLLPFAVAGTSAGAIEQALAAGDCRSALSLAEQGARENLNDPKARRHVGDALRCLGQTREAVLAYRDAMSLGEKDPALARLVESLASTLASLDIRVGSMDWTSPPTFRLTGSGLEVGPYALVDGIVRFRDLPPGFPFLIRTEGPGYSPSAQAVPAQAPGITGTLDIEVKYRGFGTIRLAPWSSGYVVSLKDPVNTFTDVKAGDARVTAGEITFVIAGPTGERVATDEVGPDEILAMDLAIFLPAQVNLMEVPAGSSLTWSGPPGSFAGRLDVGWNGAVSDAKTGVPILPSVVMQGLFDGSWQYTVDNPWLGSVSGTFEAVAGIVSPVPVPWRASPGLENVQRAWNRRNAQSAAPVDRRPHTALAGVSFGLAVPGLVAVVAGLKKAGEYTATADGYGPEYEAALDAGDPLKAMRVFDDREAALDGAAVWRGAALAGAGVAVAGTALGVLEIQLGRRHSRAALPPWNFQDLPTFSPLTPSTSAEGGSR